MHLLQFDQIMFADRLLQDHELECTYAVLVPGALEVLVVVSLTSQGCLMCGESLGNIYGAPDVHLPIRRIRDGVDAGSHQMSPSEKML